MKVSHVTWTEDTPRGVVQVTWNGVTYMVDGVVVPPERYTVAIATGNW